MRNDLQMQLIGDDHEQRSIATVEPPEINVRHSLSPIKARRGCEKIPAEAKLNGFLGQEFSRRVRQMNRAVAVLD